MGKIVGKKEVFGKTTYVVEQSNGHDIKATESDLEKSNGKIQSR